MFDPSDDGYEVRNQFGLEDKFVVTYAGALGMANDIDTLLHAAEHIRDIDNIQFLLVGGGKEMERLQNVSRELQLANVTFAGPQPKSAIPGFLAASDVCVAILKDIQMFRTTYPNKVFDYMAAGRPTVLAIDGVIRDVVEASGGGRFVRPGDAAAIADAVRALYADRERVTRMGAAARDYVVKHFNRAMQADDFVRLMTRIAV
jgi:glycosyltransferase involved in cell wall biosynthesis